jgi:predicted transposase YbfD/YdcC
LSKKTTKAVIKAGADYVLSVKENQLELHEDVEYSFKIQLNDKFEKINNPLDSATQIKFGHGRIERRTAYVDSNEEVITWCNVAKQFSNVKAFALVTKQCEEPGKKYTENHYYICSKAFSAEEILSITSQEWGVETMHWTLDNTLGEDHSTLRKKTKIILGNAVRKFALSNVVNFIKRKNIKTAIRSFMTTCSFNPQLLQI